MFNTLGFIFSSVMLNTRSAMALRTSFLLSTLMMCVNDLIFFALWGIILERVGNVGGWGKLDMALLFGISASSYGVAVVLFEGARKLGIEVARGGLDTYLVLPRPTALLISTSQTNVSGWGDILAGIVLLSAVPVVELWQIPWLITLILSASIVTASSLLAMQSVCFWVAGFEDVARMLNELLVGLRGYPGSIFGGTFRLFIFTLFPVGYITILPTESLRDGNLLKGFVCVAAAVVYALIASAIFDRGLRRYASGSVFVLRE